jgi:hypothetical protein
LAAGSITVSPGDDPFFSARFVHQECIKKIIAFPCGRSTGQEFIAAIGKGHKSPLREVKKVRVSCSYRIQITSQLGLSLIGRTIDSFWEKRPILTTVTTRKCSFVADIVLVGG